MGYQVFSSLVTMFLLDVLHISFAWKVTIVAVIVTDIKTFPLVWHVSCASKTPPSNHTDVFSTSKLRLLNALRFVLPSQRAEPGPTPTSIFQPLVTSSHCSLSEMDFNWHSMTLHPFHQRISSIPSLTLNTESNSTYYSDLDISRTHLLCTLFSPGIDRARRKHGNGILKLRKGSFTIKLGAVKCSFKREIRPYQRYEMWTRVLSWDAKWLYTITHFVRKDAKSGQSVVCATAVSKCVFKSGRKTVAPEAMLHDSGLLPRDVHPVPRLPPAVHPHISLSEMSQQEKDVGIEHTQEYEPTTLPPSKFLGGNGWMERQQVQESQTRRWTSDMIESERRRGMAVVNVGDLDDLEHDFSADVAVLGRHFDL